MRLGAPDLGFQFDNSYAQQLSGFYEPWEGDKAPNPTLLLLNVPLVAALGLDPAALSSPQGAAVFAGSVVPKGADPLAQAYAGHQFGGFSPQLGDGRALLIGEVIDENGQRQDIHLKGSGPTPFSRGGDGKAVLGPVLREYIMGEAMQALGIPTTRALAAVSTGETVMREGMKPGAVLTRVAQSHLRVGTFQFFAARQDYEKVRQLADYAIARHYPDLIDTKDRYLSFLSRVIENQAALVAKWVNVGFIHGVMNTDNMTISGETIDYGPCAFMDHYDANTVFSSIDHQGRYAYGQQPNMANWNLARLAETLLSLIDPDDGDNAVRLATAELNRFSAIYTECWLEGMRAKIGLGDIDLDDLALMNDLFGAMGGQHVDFTQFFRRLAEVVGGDDADVLSLFNDPSEAKIWLRKWRARLAKNPMEVPDRIMAMNRVNPVYIPRNHKVEQALQAAENDGNLAPVKTLLDVLSDPFLHRVGLEEFETPAPNNFGPYQTFCGT